MWFVPDSYDDFSNWQKDTQVLLGFYREYGIRYFKLDGINIRNKKGEANLIKMMRELTRESGNQIRFNLDITAQVRFGYFYEKHFGTLFVENRYTDWGNYYPHKTLKNIWQLSEFFPARKFQFEVLNNRRNISKYLNDQLAPSLYTIDYIFAITMPSNPLIWMEMSSLAEEDIKTLAGIIEVYKKERENMFDSEALPIGDKPDGTAFTGFQIITDKTKGYFLLFRENTNDNEYTYIINDIADVNLNINIIYTYAPEKDITIFDKISKKGELRVKMNQKRSFVFAEYTNLR